MRAWRKSRARSPSATSSPRSATRWCAGIRTCSPTRASEDAEAQTAAWEEHKRREREAAGHEDASRARRHRARPARMAARGEAAEARGARSASTGRTSTPVIAKLHEEIEEVRAEFAAVAADPADAARATASRTRSATCCSSPPTSRATRKVDVGARAAPRQPQVRAPLPRDGGAGGRRWRRACRAAAGEQDRYWDRAKADEKLDRRTRRTCPGDSTQGMCQP